MTLGTHSGISAVRPLVSLKRMVRSDKKRMIQAIAAPKEVSRMMALLPKLPKKISQSLSRSAYNIRKRKGGRKANIIESISSFSGHLKRLQ